MDYAAARTHGVGLIVDKKQLNEILEQHQKWLNNEGGKPADLRDADLRGADLRGSDLRDADLRYADLRYADLRGAAIFKRPPCAGSPLQ